MSARAIGELSLSTSPPATAAPSQHQRPREAARAETADTPFLQVLRAMGRESARGEATMRGALGAARGGRNLGAAELLVLQAGVYRYSEVIDLASKLVDRAGSGLKTVMQGQ